MSETSPKDILLYLISKSGGDSGRLAGRKKLMKLAFFAEHYNPNQKRLDPEPKLGLFDFYIFKYGPFSKDVMDAFDELKEQNLVREDDQHMKHIIRVGSKEEVQSDLKAEEIPRDIRTQIDTISQEFGSFTGAQLENKSLDYLGIGKEEKRMLRGYPIDDLIQEKRAAG